MRRACKYFKSFDLGMKSAFEYRLNFFLSLASALFPIFIQYFMWKAIYHSAGSAKVYGYDFTQMMIYVVMSGVVSKIVATGFEYEIAREIKEGGLSRFITRPIFYGPHKLLFFLGEKAMPTLLAILVAVLILAIASWQGIYTLDISNIQLFPLSLLLALLIHFMIFFCISAAAFILLEISAFFEVVRILLLVVSGGVFPLDIFGEQALRILKFLPFQYIIYFPTKLLAGTVPHAQIPEGISMQILWSLVLAILAHFVWRKGMKHYTGFGG
ncbi:MAG: ABC-2 family transporter protein [Oligoflexales bacterium]|nr:ABC-2 family transporter protein [Oligoflexales bacterium]